MLDKNVLIKEKRELWYQAQDLRKQVEEGNRLLTKEESALYDTYVEKMTDLQRNIDNLTSMDEMSASIRGPLYDGQGKVVGDKEERSFKYNRAVNNWLRYGNKDLGEDERKLVMPGVGGGGDKIELRDSGVVTASDANTAPTDVASAVTLAKKYYGGWFAAATEFRTDNANPMTWPTVDDTDVTGAVEAAGTDMQNGADDITFASKTMNGYYVGSQMVLVNNNNLMDAGFDIGSIVGKILGERLWRKASYLCTLGSGSSEPSGIATKTIGAAVGVVAGGGLITRARILQLIGKVDYAYHLSPGAGFMFSSSMMYEIAGLASSTTDNRPLWQPSMVVGVPDKLEGFPYWINNDLSAATANTGMAKRHILFGDFKEYKIRYCGPLQVIRLSERYAEKLQTAFCVVQVMDGKLILANATTYAPVKYLRKYVS